MAAKLRTFHKYKDKFEPICLTVSGVRSIAYPLMSRRGGLLVALPRDAVSEELLDEGAAGGRGLIGPSTMVEVAWELEDEEPENGAVLIVDLGTGFTKALSHDVAGETWDELEDRRPNVSACYVYAVQWLQEQGGGGRMSDYHSALDEAE